MRWVVFSGVLIAAGYTIPASRGEVRTAPPPVGAPEALACKSSVPASPLPLELRETSGLARSRKTPELLWTHNDSGNEPFLFGIDTTGALAAQVRVTNATLVDWEDLEAGPCPSGTCLFIADIGDNRQARDSVTVYMVPEPLPDAVQSDPAAAFHLKYPDGPQDAESLFILPNGDLYIVTKGRHADVALYRVTRDARQINRTTTLERVRSLWSRPGSARDRVTSATASPDGKWVAIRTYRTLHLYRTDALTASSGTPQSVEFDLAPLREKQGESVSMTNDGQVWLTSEAERKRDHPMLAQLSCTLSN